jgi:arylsulfatase A-like enzyme
MKIGWNAIQFSTISNIISRAESASSPNIVLLICDAMSAHNLSLYGYPRKTTPNLERLAERAFLYNNHYSGGNWTTPGTSSLLTGLYPWAHRAINQTAVIQRSLAGHNIFRLLGNGYFKLAYTQNYWANYLLEQFLPNIDSLLPFSDFGLTETSLANFKLKNDLLVSSHAFERMLYYGNSLLLSFLVDLYYKPTTTVEQIHDHPVGIPSTGIYHNTFTLKGLFDGIAETIIDLDKKHSPFFSYFHVFPPHAPYSPRKNFMEMFNNGTYQPVVKKDHPLALGFAQGAQEQKVDKYDAFIANLDDEIGKMFDVLNSRNVLDHTYFIIASDHGEIFERGMSGHGSPLLYEPLIRVPLIILPPGNQVRHNISTLTSNIDLLPTLLNIAGQPIPASCEGKLLPGFGGTEDPERSIFAMEAIESSAHNPFTKASYAIRKGRYKLIHYQGYPHKYFDYDEFYDLQEDKEELQNKFSKPRLAGIAKEMKKELMDAIQLANKKLAEE